MTSDERAAESTQGLGAPTDVSVDPDSAGQAPDPQAWNAPTTVDPDAMQDAPDELGGTGGENAGGAG